MRVTIYPLGSKPHQTPSRSLARDTECDRDSVVTAGGGRRFGNEEIEA